MILTRARELTASVEKLRTRQRQHESQQLWLTHAQSLEQSAASVERPRQFMRWLAELQTRDVDVGTDVVRRVSKIARALREQLEREPDQVISEDLVSKTRASVQAAAQDLDRLAKEAWQEYVQTLSAPDADLYVPFRGDARLGDLVDRALSLDREYESFRSGSYPDSAELRQSFTKLLRDREAVRAKLPQINNEQLRRFVIAAAGMGAPLSALSPEIRAWLESNNLIDSYVVRRAES